jgi:hypothetical protein
MGPMYSKIRSNWTCSRFARAVLNMCEWTSGILCGAYLWRRPNVSSVIRALQHKEKLVGEKNRLQGERGWVTKDSKQNSEQRPR